MNRDIKVLFKPTEGGAGFFYVASVPEVTKEQLAAERQELVDLGVLPRLEGKLFGQRDPGRPVDPPRRRRTQC